MTTATWSIVGAYVIWGLFPFYWKQIAFVPADQIIGHRVFWSFVTLTIVAAFRGRWDELRPALRSPKLMALYAAAAVLIGANWFAYIWAVNHNFIVETSLGYFINPLVSVVLGVVVFREHLRPLQWTAVALAALGVAYLTWAYGSLPWVALALAFTFTAYSVAKKLAPLRALEGLTLETAILAPLALAFLIQQDRAGTGAFVHAGLVPSLYMAGAGIVTTVPLLLFASGVQRVPLTLIGVFQYISPTLQFLAGVVFYGEPFTHDQALGFGAVWIALAIFAVDGFLKTSSAKPEL
ncbi:MAG: EamA family transporter RarD [Acidobacteriota bacterium]